MFSIQRCPRSDRDLAGISDVGPMDPESPRITAPDGIATLLYRMGREKWLERFLDTEGTDGFLFTLREQPWQDIYVKRTGGNVEVRPFFNKRDTMTEPG
jgi:hypothetical protein